MFHWFSKKLKKTSILDEWHTQDISGFKKIQNRDSIQCVNSDLSKALYFSVLITNDHSTQSYLQGEPSIIMEAGEWHLKGAKQFQNQVVVCMISVKHEEDIEWAKSFFEAIQHK